MLAPRPNIQRHEGKRRWMGLRPVRMPGFEPGQPVPGRTGVSTTVRLTRMFTTDVCGGVQEYAHRL
jgi:hypothetical protein